MAFAASSNFHHLARESIIGVFSTTFSARLICFAYLTEANDLICQAFLYHLQLPMHACPIRNFKDSRTRGLHRYSTREGESIIDRLMASIRPGAISFSSIARGGHVQGRHPRRDVNTDPCTFPLQTVLLSFVLKKVLRSVTK